MREELKFNILGLRDPPVLNKDIPGLEKCISTSMSPMLQYSIVFWLDHVSAAGLKADSTWLQQEVSAIFCTARVLFWIESLSLVNALHHGIHTSGHCVQFFQVCCILSSTRDI